MGYLDKLDATAQTFKMSPMFKGAWESLTSGWKQVFSGAGYVAPPQPGNTANAPADPAVQSGSYQYIIPQMFPNDDITNVPFIPPFGQDWGAYPVNLYGLSGLTGGGSTGLTPNVNQGAVFFYDEGTNSYIDLSQLSGVPQGV